jgi:hypothetical protein
MLDGSYFKTVSHRGSMVRRFYKCSQLRGIPKEELYELEHVYRNEHFDDAVHFQEELKQ